MALLLHNGTILVSLFWAPNYLYFRSSPTEWHKFCSPTLQKLLRPVIGNVFQFLADNVELRALSSSNLLLQLYLFSQKLEHEHTVKQLLLCFPGGLIIYRAPLYGGNVSEIEALEKFLASPHMANVVAANKVIGITDSGFSHLSTAAQQEVSLLLPTSGSSGPRANAAQVAWRQVRTVPSGSLIALSSS